MSTSRTLRCAVIGVGVGWNHIEGYQTSARADCVAICDANPAALRERGEKHAIPPSGRFVDYKELLADPDIDAVSICLPNFLHEPVALEALARGKHVLCEKPLAVDADAAQRIVDAAKSAGRTLMVCYNHRYRPEIVWLKEQIARGDFGRIYAAKAGWMREGWIPMHGAWFTQKDKSGGGALIDLGVHVLDLALWLMGYPRPVSVSGAAFSEFGGRGQKVRPREARPARFDVEDLGMGFVRFENGSVLTFESAWAAHREPAQDDYYVRLFGSEAGANFYTGGAQAGLGVKMFKYVNDQPSEIVPRLYSRQTRHVTAVQHFVDCCLDGTTPQSPGEHGVTGLRIIDGIYESSRTGREVTL